MLNISGSVEMQVYKFYNNENRLHHSATEHCFGRLKLQIRGCKNRFFVKVVHRAKPLLYLEPQGEFRLYCTGSNVKTYYFFLSLQSAQTIQFYFDSFYQG